MMAISSTQYVWTLFTGPFTTHLGATLAQVQVTISILIVLQTFLSPFQGYLVDLFGPRTLLSIGAIFSAASWVLAATVKTALGLYLTYGLLGGIGTGIIYVGVVGLVVSRSARLCLRNGCGRLRDGRYSYHFSDFGELG
jgi:OFA family oxalate/formate antiporter-like MFS transporter